MKGTIHLILLLKLENENLLQIILFCRYYSCSNMPKSLLDACIWWSSPRKSRERWLCHFTIWSDNKHQMSANVWFLPWRAPVSDRTPFISKSIEKSPSRSSKQSETPVQETWHSISWNGIFWGKLCCLKNTEGYCQTSIMFLIIFCWRAKCCRMTFFCIWRLVLTIQYSFLAISL